MGRTRRLDLGEDENCTVNCIILEHSKISEMSQEMKDPLLAELSSMSMVWQ
jgi:hypothetical protein